MAEPTLVEILAQLRGEGYEHDFKADGDALVCISCTSTVDVDLVRIEQTFRLEGESDPDDEVAIFGLGGNDGEKLGVYVVTYGAAMTTDDAAMLGRLKVAPGGTSPAT